MCFLKMNSAESLPDNLLHGIRMMNSSVRELSLKNCKFTKIFTDDKINDRLW